MSKPFTVRILRAPPTPMSLLERRWPRTKGISSEIETQVKVIIEEVRRRGDSALIDFTRRFDDVDLDSNRLRISRDEIEDAYEKVSGKQISAIKFAKSRVESLERNLLKQMGFKYEDDLVKIRSCICPIQSVGCYVPGGEASYPSTLIMTVVPAKVAGVPRIVVCTPPRGGGEVDPLTLVAADICGVDEIYGVGGAQAIAAMAYGTESIKPVEKIVGPGNKYVVTAKILVSSDVPIDFPAGPSEILILADESADPNLVALDMISQAEHGVEGTSILVTTSIDLAEKVVKELEERMPRSSNAETVFQNLSRNGLVLVCEDTEGALAFVNGFAPEHLEVMTKDAWSVAEKIRSAGLILIGNYTPVSASDYCLGTNHVLPTGGFARIFSGLSVLDFVRRINIVECSESGLSKIRSNIEILAESEGLLNHALAVKGRFGNGRSEKNK